MASAHVAKPPDPIMDQSANALDHAQQRDKRLRSSVIAGLLLKPLALLSPLVITPLLVRYLNAEGFGLFQAIVGFSMLLGLSNVGLQQGLVNRLIDCHVRGDLVMARRYISSLAVTLAMLLGVVSIIWTAAAILLPWGRIFKVTNEQFAWATPWVAWCTGVAILLGLVLIIPTAVYTAGQEQAKVYFWEGLAKLAILVATIAVVCIPFRRLGTRLLAVALATAAVPVVTNIFSTLVLYKRRPWLRPRLADFDGSIVRSVLGDGFQMFLLQMAVIIMFQCDDTLIGVMVSPEAVTPYALLGQIFVMAYGLLFVLLGPMMPAYGEAFRRGDVAWVRRGLRLCVLAGFTLIGGCGVTLMLFGDFVFRIWTRGVVTHVPAALILAVTAMFLIRVWIDSHSTILNPANILKPQVRFFIAHLVLNLGFAIVLVRPFGVAGIAWSPFIAGMLSTAWGYPGLLRKALRDAVPAAPVL